ncbi:TRAP transporter small permease [Fusibacter ferrireducens]|uniref:TRAP transporter small permease n=1 Tax=Fusibacter ferrireducens TaxID=2785058 RepID=A0ABR9ZZB9_9FIRM|nr:TRAP transporter small permease [Fusibacter ferrireducens]MBF4695789.1 TRAP transporter small permease [Fusibacter ferrireducens]
MKVIKWLDEYFEEYLLVILLAIISTVMMGQIIMRYVFHASLSWPEELTRYCFIWSVFVGTSYSIKKRNMLRIDAITTFFPEKVKEYLEIIIELVVFIFFGFLLINSVEVVEKLMISGQRSPAMELPMVYVYSATVFGFGLSIVRSVQNLFKLTKALKHKKIQAEGGN